MAFCSSCGAKTEDGAKFCPSCGVTVDAPAAQPVASAQQASAYTPDADAQNNKVIAALGYVLFLIPLLAAPKDSKFARYHANQGLVLNLAAIIWGIVYSILVRVLWYIPFVGWAIISLLGFAWLLYAALAVIGILNAVNGRTKPLPVIGGITLLK